MTERTTVTAVNPSHSFKERWAVSNLQYTLFPPIRLVYDHLLEGACCNLSSSFIDGHSIQLGVFVMIDGLKELVWTAEDNESTARYVHLKYVNSSA